MGRKKNTKKVVIQTKKNCIDCDYYNDCPRMKGGDKCFGIDQQKNSVVSK
jgi:hypothetical protein